MLHFVPRYGIVSPALVRPSRLTWRRAINDNEGGAPTVLAARKTIADPRVQAALRLFAVHGLAAAERARTAAGTADACGDERNARWWHDISQMLG